MATTKVALITGCSSGVGASLAARMAVDGYCVYATVRNPTKLDGLREALNQHSVSDDSFNATGKPVSKQVRVRTMDVSKDASVTSCLDDILAESNKRLDVVVNNAGYTEAGLAETIPMESVVSQYQTNVFGVIRVCQVVLPLMRHQGFGRCLVISSLGGINGVPFNDVYCSSKFAVEGLIESMAPLYRAFNVYCSLIEPGAIRTNFVANAKRAPIVGGNSDVDKRVTKMYETYMEAMGAGFKEGGPGQNGDQVAQYIVDKALKDDVPSVRYQTNDHPTYVGVVKAKLADPTGDVMRDGMFERFFKANEAQ